MPSPQPPRPPSEATIHASGDVGIKETADGQVVYSPGAGNWGAYNSLTSATNSVYNQVVVDQLLGNFWYFGTDGTICEDKEFGSFETSQARTRSR